MRRGEENQRPEVSGCGTKISTSAFSAEGVAMLFAFRIQSTLEPRRWAIFVMVSPDLTRYLLPERGTSVGKPNGIVTMAVFACLSNVTSTHLLTLGAFFTSVNSSNQVPCLTTPRPSRPSPSR